MAASWKKIILENDPAALAAVTASAVKFSGDIPLGATEDDVLVVTSTGIVKQIAQGDIAGENTTYTGSLGITLDVGTNTTFSVDSGSIDHDQLLNHDEDEHVKWATDQNGATEINIGNYTNTTYAAGEGISFGSADAEGNYTASTSADQSHITTLGTLTSGSIGGSFGDIFTGGEISSSGGIQGGQVVANTLNTVDMTVSSTLVVTNNLQSANVAVTGSMFVNGDFTLNDTSYSDQIAAVTTGNTIWGNSGANTHYFSGSVGVTGDVSASSFTGPGGGITNIPGTGITGMQSLTQGNGINSFTYNGAGAQAISAKVADAGGLAVDGYGLSIAPLGVTQARIGSGAVNNDKLADQSVSQNKLQIGLISNMGSQALSAANNIMVSTGSGAGLGRVSVSDISTYFQNYFNTIYSTTIGTVTSVTTNETEASGLFLSQSAGTSTLNPTIMLTGSIEINDDNWGTGDLSIAHGGTGASNRASAAANLLNTGLLNFTLGSATDKIIIPGDLEVLGSTVEIESTNLEISDQYILIGSGSTTSDVGIKFGETPAVANLLFWDYGYDGNKGRFAVGHGIDSTIYNASSTVNLEEEVKAYHLAGVFSGSLSAAATANADMVGNIKLDGGFAYIYA